MAIPVAHLWKQRASDLRGLREMTALADLRTQVPLPLRRAQMSRDGIPRHLYKFRGAVGDASSRQRLKDMLLGNQLYAATAEKLNDPFDSSAAYRVLEEGPELREMVRRFFLAEGADLDLAEAFSNDQALLDSRALAHSLEEGHRSLLQQVGICALAGERRSTLLWSHYAQEHRGVAVQYRPSLDPMALQVSQVQYSDAFPVVDDYFNKSSRNLLLPLLQKASPWEYEKEWRVIRVHEANRTFTVRPEALTGVVLGMSISPVDREFIHALAEERDRVFSTRTAIYQAERVSGSYALRSRRIA